MHNKLTVHDQKKEGYVVLREIIATFMRQFACLISFESFSSLGKAKTKDY